MLMFRPGQAITSICMIEKSTVSHIWIYFAFDRPQKR